MVVPTRQTLISLLFSSFLYIKEAEKNERTKALLAKNSLLLLLLYTLF